MAFFLKAIGLSDDIPGFPFTPAANDPGHIVYTSPLMCWTVRAGTTHEDAHKKISIFTGSVAAGNNSSELVRQLARNAMRRAKSLMIPGFLKCLGATEYRDTVYIATEQCLSLKEVLESRELRTQLYGAAAEEYHASVAYGISTVGGALCSLHQNKLIHGNVNCQAIFVIPSSGMWRLFGLELVSSPEEMGTNNPNCAFDSARRAGVLEGYRCPPELSPSSGAPAAPPPGNPDAFAIDAWGMAGLLYETVGITVDEAVDGKLNTVMHSLSNAELRNACRQTLPKSLHSGCAGITAINPRMRKSVAAFLEHCEFVKDSAFVQYMKGLSEALLLDVTQQVRLVESLTDVVDSFPLRPCLCYVLPRLGELIRAAARPGSPNGAAGVSIGPVVAPVLKIAARTSAGEDFDTHVTPVLVQMFQSPDVLMRYKLLVGAEVYGAKLSSTALNNLIWPLYAKGFQYATPSVREFSARALVHLAPHMSEAVLGEQVPKALGLLQRDQDGALRANATIALHLISAFITPPAQRASVVLNYCRPMLRDAFEPSRVAALRSLRGAVECLSAKQLAEGVLPAVSPLAVDPTSEESRAAALALMKAAMGKLEEHHKQLTAQQPAVPGSAPAASATTAAAAAKPGSPHPQADGSSHTQGTSSTHGGNGASWGWGLFNGSPPATPAATAPLAGGRHTDPSASASSTPPVAGGAGGNANTNNNHNGNNSAAGIRASPFPGSTTSAASVLPTPVVLSAAAPAAGGSGWSDDDDIDGDDALRQHSSEGDGVSKGGMRFKSAGASQRAPVFGLKPKTTSTTTTTTTAATTNAFVGSTAAAKASNDGWDDDEDGEGEDVVIKPAAMKVKPIGLSSISTASVGRGPASAFPGSLASSSTAKPAAPATGSSASSAFHASPLPIPSNASTTSAGSASPAGSSGSPTSIPGQSAPSGPMKLRKKGGLGAARLD